MNSKELCSIREWAPLDVLDRIPTRLAATALFLPTDVLITCVDAISEFLALGSNVGIVFWYNRQTGELQKLKPEVCTSVTCVRIVDSVEYMIAAGHTSGNVSVFQIHKQLPQDLNEIVPWVKPKPIERYTIRDLHGSRVSCCEWTKNGMKLFSGDCQGSVVQTEFDYQAHLSKSVEILNEAYEIIQLSVHKSNLLISTLYRTIICQRSATADTAWNIVQVGKKDRKQLVPCGGIFLPTTVQTADNMPTQQQQPQLSLLCGRPGLRFWIADLQGNVQKTLLFKDTIALQSPKWEIPILNPMKRAAMRQGELANTPDDSMYANSYFCKMWRYAGHNASIVTHDEKSVYILNLEKLQMDAVARRFRNILDFCVCEKEIFVLEGPRSLIRLAPAPEKPNKTAHVIFNPSMPPPVPTLGLINDNNFEAPAEFNADNKSAVIDGEECFELPAIEALNLDIPIELAVESPRNEQNRRLQIFQEIAVMKFDDSILHSSSKTPKRRKNAKVKAQDKNEMVLSCNNGIVEIGQLEVNDFEKQAVEEKSTNCGKTPPKTLKLLSKATPMDASYCIDDSSTSNFNVQKALAQHLPELPTPQTLEKSIKEKAKALALELNLPDVCLAPITAEELNHCREVTAAPPASVELLTSVYPLITPTKEVLEQEFPTAKLKQNAAMKVSPRKKASKTSPTAEQLSNCAYAAGQPVDDVSQIFCSNEIEPFMCMKKPTPPLIEEQALQFIQARPSFDEIHSFLPDFQRAQNNVLGVLQQNQQDTGDSTTSSEWEFLDN